jgi:Fe-S-cluster-containing hydrogenase component 2
VCPVTAIRGVKKEFYFVDPKICIGCGACGRACPYDAIFDTLGNTADKIRRTEWAPSSRKRSAAAVGIVWTSARSSA